MSDTVPIDLEALKSAPRPLPGKTDAQRNWEAVRSQMHGERSPQNGETKTGGT